MEFFNDVGGDPLKPTLFELIAQEQLRDLLQPALKYVLSVSDMNLHRRSAYMMSLVPTGLRTKISALFTAYCKPT